MGAQRRFIIVFARALIRTRARARTHAYARTRARTRAMPQRERGIVLPKSWLEMEKLKEKLRAVQREKDAFQEKVHARARIPHKRKLSEATAVG